MISMSILSHIIDGLTRGISEHLNNQLTLVNKLTIIIA